MSARERKGKSTEQSRYNKAMTTLFNEIKLNDNLYIRQLQGTFFIQLLYAAIYFHVSGNNELPRDITTHMFSLTVKYANAKQIRRLEVFKEPIRHLITSVAREMKSTNVEGLLKCGTIEVYNRKLAKTMQQAAETHLLSLLKKNVFGDPKKRMGKAKIKSRYGNKKLKKKKKRTNTTPSGTTRPNTEICLNIINWAKTCDSKIQRYQKIRIFIGLVIIGMIAITFKVGGFNTASLMMSIPFITAIILLVMGEPKPNFSDETMQGWDNGYSGFCSAVTFTPDTETKRHSGINPGRLFFPPADKLGRIPRGKNHQSVQTEEAKKKTRKVDSTETKESIAINFDEQTIRKHSDIGNLEDLIERFKKADLTRDLHYVKYIGANGGFYKRRIGNQDPRLIGYRGKRDGETDIIHFTMIANHADVERIRQGEITIQAATQLSPAAFTTS